MPFIKLGRGTVVHEVKSGERAFTLCGRKFGGIGSGDAPGPVTCSRCIEAAKPAPVPHVACYVRVSTPDQRTDSQEDALRAWLQTEGIEPTAVAWFIDKASGKRKDREALGRLLAEVQGGRVRLVVATRLSRLTRGGVGELHHLFEQLRTAGARLVFTEQPELVLDGIGGRLLFVILAELASIEADRIGERVREGMASAKSRGRHVGRPRAPLDAEDLRRRYDDGERQAALASRYNVSLSTIRRALGLKGS